MRVSWRAQARHDLEDLYDYIAASGSPEAALSFTTAIEKFVVSIGEVPHAGRSHFDLRPGLRTRAFKSVIVAYVVGANSVMIYRIVHHSRDYGRLLRREI